MSNDYEIRARKKKTEKLENKVKSTKRKDTVVQVNGKEGTTRQQLWEAT